MEEVTADVVDVAREVELDLESEDVTELLQSHDKLELMKGCFLQMSQESGLLRWNLLLVKMLGRL